MAILAQENPVFQRAMRVISSITRANPAVVTTTFAHQYQNGLIARLNIPAGYGMTQANQLQGVVTVTGDTTFIISIDTTQFDQFLTVQSLGSTDVSGNATGNIYTSTTVYNPPASGQTFTIGTQLFTIVAGGGNLYTTGTGSGTINLSNGDYTFSSCAALQYIYWNPISFPQSQQYAIVVPVGEISDTLINATQNILPLEGV